MYASVRTGSNYLESILNQFPHVVCHGEIFNKDFVGLHKDWHEKIGLGREDLEKRDADVESVYRRVIEGDAEYTIPGFRLFALHNDWVFHTSLHDTAVKKIILKRDTLASYISMKQAAESNCWRINPQSQEQLVKSREKYAVKIHFDAADFDNFRKFVASFYGRIENALNESNQTPLMLWYRELGSDAANQKLAEFLGTTAPTLDRSKTTVQQSTASLENRVSNPEELKAFIERTQWAKG